MNWKQKIEETLNQVSQMKNNIYPDAHWKPENIPKRKDLKLLHNLIESMIKDFQWVEEYKNPKKSTRKTRLVELKPELSQFMRLKERGFSGYPENYILLFHLHYFYAIDALEKNYINTEKFTPEIKNLYPELTGTVSLFKLQTYIKNYILLDENGKRKIVEKEDLNTEKEIQFLKDMKELKKNKDEFKSKWNDFLNLRI